MRQLSVGTRLVHGDRQLVRQHLRHLVDRDVVLGGDLLDGVVAEHRPEDLTWSPKPACSSLATTADSPPWLPVPMTSLITTGNTAAPIWPSALLKAGLFSSESRMPMVIPFV